MQWLAKGPETVLNNLLKSDTVPLRSGGSAGPIRICPGRSLGPSTAVRDGEGTSVRWEACN
ncbi:hypothetical protein GCM10022284_58260 [Streptomyces hundungensis]